MSFGDWLKKASPTILTVLGAAGTVATAVMTAKATPDARMRAAAAEHQKGDEKLTLVETVKAQAPAYFPAAAVGICTIGCIFGANLLNQRQQASLASAYALLDQTYRKYKDKVRLLFGEAGDHMVEKAVKQSEKDVEDDRPPWDEVQTFYFEPYGKFFERTMEQVFQAEYHINRNLMLKQGVTVNEFLDFLELEHVDRGDEVGWNLWDGEAFYGYSWIDFVHRYYNTEDGLVVCAIDTPFPPHPEETEFSGEQMYNPESAK
ncbi:MAG: DUF6353 family protein [Clostridia bacterium]